MATEARHHPALSIGLPTFGPLAAAGVLLILVLATGAWLGGPGTTPASPDGLPADVQALGSDVHPIPGDGMVTADAAIQAFEAVYGPMPGVERSAYLVALTDPDLLGGLRERALWIIRYERVDLPMPAPNHPALEPETVDRVGTLYAYVDARSGEWLLARTD